MASSGLLPVEAVDRGVDFVVGGDVLAALGVLDGGEGGAGGVLGERGGLGGVVNDLNVLERFILFGFVDEIAIVIA